MTTLSPAAQAVLSALNTAPAHTRLMAAAVIRAAADQVVPNASPLDRGYWSPFAAQIRAEWLAIAAELEGQP
jgi:hypothetical protein